jgi:hypothetical protein
LIGATWYGTVTIESGNAKSTAHVRWIPVTSFQGIEEWRPTGTVAYEPETDYGPSCWFLSMWPTSAVIDPNLGLMYIDRNQDPPVAFGYGTTETWSTTCFNCDGWDQPECNSGPLPGWFAADSLAVREDAVGPYMSRTWTVESLPPVTHTVEFFYGTP